MKARRPTPRRAASCSPSKACRQDRRYARRTQRPAHRCAEAAIDGFLKSTGLKLDELTVQDDKKGNFYIAHYQEAGPRHNRCHRRNPARYHPQISLAQIHALGLRPLALGAAACNRSSAPSMAKSCLSRSTASPPATPRAAIASWRQQEIRSRRFEDYAQKLHEANVIVDADARAETIRAEAKNLAFAQGLELIEDEGLLKEIAGLVEWPVVLMGEFDTKFLDLPPEVIVTTIKNHQKCFALKRRQDRQARQPLLLVSNMVASDGGKRSSPAITRSSPHA